MRIQFWGAARTVTGSTHLIEVNGHRVLLDCGMFQGPRAFETNRDLPFGADSIEAVVLSHAHLDHSGNLPTLVREGFRGTIYCTSATRDLCAYMLLDSAKIQEEEVAYVNRIRDREGKRLWEPLYTRQDALATFLRFASFEYGRTFEVVPGVRVQFRDAGHILGSAIVVVDLEEGDRKLRLLFSGDLGRPGLAILRDPEFAEGVNVLVMESTYGNREHEAMGEGLEILRESVRKAHDRKGKLLIPAFALGRTQEIVYRLDQMWEEKVLPPIDIFVDSPLAVNVTDVFRLHPECYDQAMRDALLQEADHDPLGFRHLRYVRSVEASKRLNHLTSPAVIISASGMCEGGRILHHLKNSIEDPRTTILFVGYQAAGTLGRHLVDGGDKAEIFGHPYPVRAHVQRAEGYSAHADREELLDWAGRVAAQGDLRRTFLVHGEEESALALAASLRDRGTGGEVEVPERGRAFDL